MRRIHHRQDALDLAAEVGVAGGVDDVDAGVVPIDRGRLGQDGDAALLFEVVGVHCAFGDALVFAERARLAEKLIDQRGFAMVDVRDDRDVSNIHDGFSGVRRRPVDSVANSVARLIHVFSQLRKGWMVTEN